VNYEIGIKEIINKFLIINYKENINSYLKLYMKNNSISFIEKIKSILNISENIHTNNNSDIDSSLITDITTQTNSTTPNTIVVDIPNQQNIIIEKYEFEKHHFSTVQRAICKIVFLGGVTIGLSYLYSKLAFDMIPLKK
jgi:hypothetical protein